jgi:hypothetical protein
MVNRKDKYRQEYEQELELLEIKRRKEKREQEINNFQDSEEDESCGIKEQNEKFMNSLSPEDQRIFKNMLYNQLKKDLKIMDLGRKIIEGRIK